MHKVKGLSQFHAQLAYCVVQFIEKDPTVASVVINGLLQFWPITSCSKELLFLSELEEVLELTDQNQFYKFIHPLFYRIATCIGSSHFQVAERALFLWNNDAIATFMSDHRQEVLPLLYPALYANLETHWNTTVHQLTQHIMQQFKDMDGPLFEKIEKQFLVNK
ncbi:serine/threonine protein phosphatase 2A (PP2A) regulatory subunit B', partial [Reticulomyxa filosa]